MPLRLPSPIVLLLLAATAAPGPLHAQTTLDELQLQVVATDLPGSLVDIQALDDDKLLLVMREGAIFVWDGEKLLEEPFLDLRGQVSLEVERGMASVALHPDHESSGRLFVSYTNLAGDTVLARFEVFDDDPERADPATRANLLIVPQPGASHNGGQLQFGPDGYLYLALGDGGAGICHGQRIDTLLGKMLRLDVDNGADQPPFHSIPTDNPYVGPGDPFDEVWASGLRNPYRYSFDRLTGDLFIADVGFNEREEIDFQPADSAGGENYGWEVLEGTFCLGDRLCPLELPPCDDPGYTPPILEYTHEEGCAVVGGYVYRGQEIPGLQGTYFYGDFCTGVLRAAQREGDGWVSHTLDLSVPLLVSFGEDANGELYLASLNGTLYRLRGLSSACLPGPNTLCLNEGRFRVETEWETPQGGTGVGFARPLTDDTGTFWFFEEENIEMVVKVIDACVDPFNRFWVFAGGLTNVGVHLTVTDTEVPTLNEYRNPLGTPFQPIQDTNAFETCP